MCVGLGIQCMQYIVQLAQDALAKGLYSQKEGRQIEVECSPVRFRHISFFPMPYMVRYTVLKPEVSDSICTCL
jgi:hypothetical protein